MPTGVHYTWSLGCIFRSSLLLDGKRIHIKPRKHYRTRFATLKDSDNTRLPNTSANFQSEFRKFPRYNPRSAHLLKSQFRVTVEIPA
jgi:hypothetical protein